MEYDNQFPGFEDEKDEQFNQFMSHDFSEKKGRNSEDGGDSQTEHEDDVEQKKLTQTSQRDGGNMKKIDSKFQIGVLALVTILAGLFFFKDQIFSQRAPAPNPYAFSQQPQPQFAPPVPSPNQNMAQGNQLAGQQTQNRVGVAPVPNQQPLALAEGRQGQELQQQTVSPAINPNTGIQEKETQTLASAPTPVSEDSLKKFQEIVATENQKVIDGITLLNSTTCSTDGSKEQDDEIQTLQAEIKKLNGQIAHVRNLERKHRHELEDFKKKVAEQAVSEVRAAVEAPSPSNEKLKDWRLLGMNSDMCVFQSPAGVKKLYRKGDSLEGGIVVMAIYPKDQMVRTTIGPVHLSKK